MNSLLYEGAGTGKIVIDLYTFYDVPIWDTSVYKSIFLLFHYFWTSSSYTNTHRQHSLFCVTCEHFHEKSTKVLYVRKGIKISHAVEGFKEILR